MVGELLQHRFGVRQQVFVGEFPREVSDRAADVRSYQIEKFLGRGREPFDRGTCRRGTVSAVSDPASRLFRSLVGALQFPDLVLKLVVDGVQFLVERLKLLFRGFQFLVGRLKFLVHRRGFLVRRLQFLVGGFQMLDGVAQFGAGRHQFFLERALAGRRALHGILPNERRAGLGGGRARREADEQMAAVPRCAGNGVTVMATERLARPAGCGH